MEDSFFQVQQVLHPIILVEETMWVDPFLVVLLLVLDGFFVFNNGLFQLFVFFIFFTIVFDLFWEAVYFHLLKS